MPRQMGSRNKGFAQKKDDLLQALAEFALNTDLRLPSLRALAQSVDVTEPTLRHYFGDRQGVIEAILLDIARRGQVIWEAVGSPSPSPEAALQTYFDVSLAGMRHGGFVRTHMFGIIEGLADPEIGRVYARHILEPSLQSFITKLKSSGGGHLSNTELRTAALMAFSPLLVLSLHQDLFGTQSMEPVEVEAVISVMRDWLSHNANES